MWEKGREDCGKASIDWFNLLRNLILIAQKQQHVGLLSKLNYWNFSINNNNKKRQKCPSHKDLHWYVWGDSKLQQSCCVVTMALSLSHKFSPEPNSEDHMQIQKKIIYLFIFFFLLKVLDSDLGWRYLIRITYLNSSFYYIEHKYRYSASQVCQCKLLCPSGKIIKSLKYVCQKYWGINHHNRVVRTN